MPPRWESPFDHPSPRDAALLAEVIGALQAHLTEPQDDAAPTEDVQELISAAVAELQRVSPLTRPATGVAPVLGSGVVQELLRRRRIARQDLLPEPEPTVDQRR